jgi:hypothetical protein
MVGHGILVSKGQSRYIGLVRKGKAYVTTKADLVTWNDVGHLS